MTSKQAKAIRELEVDLQIALEEPIEEERRLSMQNTVACLRELASIASPFLNSGPYTAYTRHPYPRDRKLRRIELEESLARSDRVEEEWATQFLCGPTYRPTSPAFSPTTNPSYAYD